MRWAAAVINAARKFREQRGRHDGDHEFRYFVGNEPGLAGICVKCDASYIPLEAALDKALDDYAANDGGATERKCKAGESNTGGGDPQECDWPRCGCDPNADKVISTLYESGALIDGEPKRIAALEADLSALWHFATCPHEDCERCCREEATIKRIRDEQRAAGNEWDRRSGSVVSCMRGHRCTVPATAMSDGVAASHCCPVCGLGVPKEPTKGQDAIRYQVYPSETTK